MINIARYTCSLCALLVTTLSITLCGQNSYGLDGLPAPLALSLFGEELDNEGFPSDLARAGIANLSFIKFVSSNKLIRVLYRPEMLTASYYPDINGLFISRRFMETRSRMLLPINQLGSEDTGTILHELWHSYYNSSESPKDYIMRNTDILYLKYESRFRKSIHEEAYGLFIEKVTQVFLQTEKALKQSTPAVREGLKKNPMLVNIYERLFSEPCYGYYRPTKRTLIWSTVPIEDRDKQFILKVLFHNKITGKFDLDFEKF